MLDIIHRERIADKLRAIKPSECVPDNATDLIRACQTPEDAAGLVTLVEMYQRGVADTRRQVAAAFGVNIGE
jgi:hypothetical protein